MAKSRYNEIYYRKIKKAPPRNVYMERFFEHLEGGLKNYSVNTCCLLFPLRKGLLIIGYINVFVEMILLIGAATGTISPLFMKIQEGFADAPSQSIGVAIPATQLAFIVVLLCATHRNDVGLLRFYMLYGCVAIGLTVVSYAIVMVILNIFFVFALIASVAYQAYILLLVRSLIVKIRQAKCEVRMMSLKDLLNRKEIDVEAPAPVHRPIPKDAGPGPLAAIVGNPKVEIVVKSEPTDADDLKTLAEIKKETEIMAENIKKSNIELKNKEAVDKINNKTYLTDEIRVQGSPQEKGPKSKGVLNAKLSFLGMNQTETKKDRLNTENETLVKEDKDATKLNKTIFGSKPDETYSTSEKENRQTTEKNEKTKDKKDGKQKKTIFGIKRKDTNKIKNLPKKEVAPESAETEDSKPEATNSKKDQKDKKENSTVEETRVIIETKITNNNNGKAIETITVPTRSQKETKPIKEKRKIHKETKGSDEMEEIELDVDIGNDCKGGTKLETIEEEPRKKWFWKK